MSLDEIVLCCNYNSVPLVVAWESIIDPSQIFANFNGSMQWLIPIKSPIGCENEVEIPKVAREVAMAKVIGELSVQI